MDVFCLYKKKLLIGLLVCFQSIVFAQQERIYVFTDLTSSHPATHDFNANYLNSLQELFAQDSIQVEVIDVKDGSPKEVHSIPSIYYANSKGLYFYKGRYATLDRIHTFVKNNRRFTFGNSSNSKENVFVSTQHGFETGLVLKIKNITGERTLSSKEQESIKAQIYEGMKKENSIFHFKESYSFREQSKLFYLNIYPYKSKKGVFYVTTECFSQHSCVEPIKQELTAPLEGKNITKLSEELMRNMEGWMTIFYQDSVFKDGLEVIETKTEKSWQSLGYTPQQVKTSTQAKGLSSLKEGQYKARANVSEPIFFSFEPPVSQYAGTIDDLKGVFSFENMVFKGEFDVKLASLNMGEEILNESVLVEQLLIDQFGEASLAFSMEADAVPYGETFAVPASLSLLGLSKDVMLNVSFNEDETGSSFALVNFSFSIDPFSSLEKPDGPSPQNETLFVSVVVFFDRQN